MNEHQDMVRAHTGTDPMREAVDATPVEQAIPEPVPAPAAEPLAQKAATGPASGREDWHAQAGRKGARRIHQLIEHGRLYEQEHGLKRGRQRLRQLIQLGKLYEQEHDLPAAVPRPRSERLSRMRRDELLSTLLHCLVRLARPSFRAELLRLLEQLPDEGDDHAA